MRSEPGLAFILPLIATLTKEPEMAVLRAYNAAKFDWGRGSVPDPDGEALPQTS